MLLYKRAFKIRFYSGSDLPKIKFDPSNLITPKITCTSLDQIRSRKASNPDRIWSEILKNIISNFELISSNKNILKTS